MSAFRVGFLLLPDFPMIAFSTAVEPLRIANRVSKRALYSWQVLSLDGREVPASNGLALVADGSLDELATVDLLCICGGTHAREALDADAHRTLRAMAQRGVALGGLCGGTCALLDAGLLAGYRWTVHWDYLAQIGTAIEGCEPENDLFVVDRDRYTATGGIGPMDMMLHLISQHHGRALAAEVAEHLHWERLREASEPQPMPLDLRLAHCPPVLRELVGLMEGNLYEPMLLSDLARLVGITARQAERLFQRYFDITPGRYYLGLRLERARRLLRNTDMTVGAVAVDCGFVSSPHFSKAYRKQFGHSPRRSSALCENELLVAASA